MRLENKQEGRAETERNEETRKEGKEGRKEKEGQAGGPEGMACQTTVNHFRTHSSPQTNKHLSNP